MKKLKGIITSILLSQIIFLMIPFNIHADSTTNTAPFLGFNVQITGYGENMSSIQIPKINFSYAGNTVPSGYISGKLNCTSPSTPTSSAPCDIFSLTNNNGSYSDLAGLKVVFPLQSYLLDANGNAIINHQSYFFIDYEFILDDNYKGNVVITSSDNIDHNIYVNGNNFHYETFTQDPANPLTFTISSYDLVRVRSNKLWNVEPESFSFVNACLNNLELTDINGEIFLNYPIFKMNKGDIFAQTISRQSSDNDAYKETVLCFWINRGWSYNSFRNYFTFTDGNINDFGRIQTAKINGVTWQLVKLYWNGFGSTMTNPNSMTYNRDEEVLIVPIYNNFTSVRAYSTDFAIRYNLDDNRELQHLNLLANGNSASNQAASDLQQSTDSMQDKMDDMVDIESGYNQQFNNSLNNIDFTNPIQNNAGILPAANFVITVFNGLVNNPLSILIIIICILTIGKKVIGK